MEEFDREFGSLHRSIFANENCNVRPFVSGQWDLVLVPYGCNMEERDFRGLMLAAAACGDREIIVADAETKQPSEAAVVVEASFTAFETVKFRAGTNLTIMDVHIFGRSGYWGCICAASYDDVAIVGGDGDFMTRYLAAVGGIAVLRHRFLKFANSGWSVGDDVRSRLLGMAGW
ncbi:MAG: hypothetical protein U1C73_19520 [Dietzia sp.]|nr:hypothetical protein [Dietzia sp.]